MAFVVGVAVCRPLEFRGGADSVGGSLVEQNGADMTGKLDLQIATQSFHTSAMLASPDRLGKGLDPEASDRRPALIHLLEHHDGPEPVNVGTGEDLTIAELATLVADIVGYRGAIDWDTTRPDGTPRKLLDIGPLRESGWRPSIMLPDGIRSTWEWYRSHPHRSGA
jgi:hypothetical protein